MNKIKSTMTISDSKFEDLFYPKSTLLALGVVAAVLPGLVFFIIDWGFNYENSSSISSWLVGLPFMIGLQIESLIFACSLLSIIVFIWPNKRSRKIACVIVVLFFHTVLGMSLIQLRTL